MARDCTQKVGTRPRDALRLREAIAGELGGTVEQTPRGQKVGPLEPGARGQDRARSVSEPAWADFADEA
jgi:hypothetical protein